MFSLTGNTGPQTSIDSQGGSESGSGFFSYVQQGFSVIASGLDLYGQYRQGQRNGWQQPGTPERTTEYTDVPRDIAGPMDSNEIGLSVKWQTVALVAVAVVAYLALHKG